MRSYQAFRPCVAASSSGKKNGRVLYFVDVFEQPASRTRTVTTPKEPHERKIGRFRGLRICCALVLLLHPACQSLKPQFFKSLKPGSPDHTFQKLSAGSPVGSKEQSTPSGQKICTERNSTSVPSDTL